MKKFLPIIIVLVTLVGALFIFQKKDISPEGTGREREEPSSELQTIKGVVVASKSEKDGKTIIFSSEGGTSYQVVISIPNLGPNSTFDFNDLAVGSTLEITGEVWDLAGMKQLSARSVKTISRKLNVESINEF